MRYTAPMTKKTALITGASGGLGEEFARLCAQDKMNLVLVARREDALKKIAAELEKEHGVSVTVIAQDLSAPDAVQTIVGILKKGNVSIDVLINNAGFGSFGKFHEADANQQENMIAVNIAALTALTRALLPEMVTRGHGRILNVASIAAFLPGPLMSVYYASKAYVLHFSLAIREELKGAGVTVTCVCPGPTHTGFELHANLGTSKLFKGSNVMKASDVAAKGYAACMKGKPLVTPGILNKLAAFTPRLLPRTLAAIIAKKVQDPL